LTSGFGIAGLRLLRDGRRALVLGFFAAKRYFSTMHDGPAARFDGVSRLYSPAVLSRLRSAHVCVIGIGGVGSWTVEALARSGIGQLTMIDLDEVCVSNINRQLHALDATVGLAKVNVMAKRVHAINPGAVIHARQAFFTEANADELLAANFDFVVDAIDRTTKKALLIGRCHARNIPIITVGAAGGRTDPTAVRILDLARATQDRLLQGVRSRLRRDFGFPKGGKPLGIDCVCSTEAGAGGKCEPREPGQRIGCDNGYGSACHVTGAFGFAAAGYVIQQLANAGRQKAG
jgi:tRNA A37 threonylcarbamoyladenosine dehydratase